MLAIEHVAVYTAGAVVEVGTVLIEAGRIKAVGPAAAVETPAGARQLDGRGLLLAPGFLDLQVNGGFGHDFARNPETIWEVAAALPQYGVTAFLPTIVTSPLATVQAAQQTIGQQRPAQGGATPLGLHLEGPFLNPEKKGAHVAAYLRLPLPPGALDWSPATGVRLVTLAPELPGALDLAGALVQRGVVVSAGHTMATRAQMQAGFDAGIAYGTHLFNAMRPLGHREPGVIEALLTHETATIGLIVDGIHVHPALVNLVWRLARPRINLVSDAIAALNMPPGIYQISDQTITVTATESRLADGTLAGSVAPLDAVLRNLRDFTGCSLAEALATVTTTPAALLNMAGRKGRIAAGYDADLVLLTPEWRVAATIVAGEVAYESSEFAAVQDAAW